MRAFVTIGGACMLLGVSRRRFAELRTEPDFPSGRTFGGRAALRFSVQWILEWAEQQPEARFSTRGGSRSRRPGGAFAAAGEAA